MPTFASEVPLYFFGIPEQERALRCELTSDTCVIDGDLFFVRGCIEIPVEHTSEPFIYGAWVSLSAQSFEAFVGCLDASRRAHIGPFFGWLSAELALYPSTENLKTRVHLRDDGIRPSIELEPTDHPLAVEQRNGIKSDRVAEIYAFYVHGQQ